MASTVAESSPPDSNTTARTAGLLSRDIAPQHLVKLQLEPHRQAICEDPVGELPCRQLLGARREQHLAACGKAARFDLRPAPLVVGTIADHELDLLLRTQQREVVVTI